MNAEEIWPITVTLSGGLVVLVEEDLASFVSRVNEAIDTLIPYRKRIGLSVEDAWLAPEHVVEVAQ